MESETVKNETPFTQEQLNELTTWFYQCTDREKYIAVLLEALLCGDNPKPIEPLARNILKAFEAEPLQFDPKNKSVDRIFHWIHGYTTRDLTGGF